jgi:hypothetical protein
VRLIIDGIAYDTDRATEVVGGDNAQCSNAWWGLYRTQNGTFFRIVVDHDGETLQECKTLTKAEARALTSAILFAALFGALVYFGYGNVSISVSTTPNPTAPAQTQK